MAATLWFVFAPPRDEARAPGAAEIAGAQADPSEPAGGAAVVSPGASHGAAPPTAHAKRGSAPSGGTLLPQARAAARQTTHAAGDFARGDLQNLRLKDGLEMGDDPAFVPRFAPFQRFGLYVSPEEPASESFDALTVDVGAMVPKGSRLTFEFRTKSPEADWTEWQELSAEAWSKPWPLSARASSWQYRLYFFADDPANSPKVRRVSVTAGQTDGAAAAQPPIP